MWKVIKDFVHRHFLDFVLILTLVLSGISYYRTCVNSSRIDALTTQISDVQKSVVALQKDLAYRLDAVQAQLDLLSKYAEAEYYHFYGDVRNTKIVTNQKSTSKTTNK